MLVQAASRQLVKQSSVMDAQLFTIKQLLILREQIAPFEADFAVTEYDLDFSHMRDHLRRIMAGLCSHMPCLCVVTSPHCIYGISYLLPVTITQATRVSNACVTLLSNQNAAVKENWLSQNPQIDCWC